MAQAGAQHAAALHRISGGEGAAAAAVAGGVGIDENKSLAHERVFVIERGAVQVQKTFRVYEDAGAELLENFIAVAGLGIEAHGVGEAGATSALNANAETALVRRDAFLGEEDE